MNLGRLQEAEQGKGGERGAPLCQPEKRGCRDREAARSGDNRVTQALSRLLRRRFVEGIEIESQAALIDWLKTSRFPAPGRLQGARGSRAPFEPWRTSSAKRNTFAFETDGAVVKVNAFSLQRQLGVKTREPRWAIAYKFQAHQATTVIRDIRGSVGRTGVITPLCGLRAGEDRRGDRFPVHPP